MVVVLISVVDSLLPQAEQRHQLVDMAQHMAAVSENGHPCCASAKFDDAGLCQEHEHEHLLQ
jgi:hypothetical protein